MIAFTSLYRLRGVSQHVDQLPKADVWPQVTAVLFSKLVPSLPMSELQLAVSIAYNISYNHIPILFTALLHCTQATSESFVARAKEEQKQ